MRLSKYTLKSLSTSHLRVLWQGLLRIGTSGGGGQSTSDAKNERIEAQSFTFDANKEVELLADIPIEQPLVQIVEKVTPTE